MSHSSSPWNIKEFSQGAGGSATFYNPNQFPAENVQTNQVSQGYSVANSSAVGNVTVGSQGGEAHYSQADLNNTWNNSWEWNDGWGGNQGIVQNQPGVGAQVGHGDVQPHAALSGDQYYNQWQQQNWNHVSQQHWQQPGQDSAQHWNNNGHNPPLVNNESQWQNNYSVGGQPPTSQYSNTVRNVEYTHQPYATQINQVVPQTHFEHSGTQGQYPQAVASSSTLSQSQSNVPSHYSHSRGLDDSTSSSQFLEQSGSSSTPLEESVNSEGGTVAGFFGGGGGDETESGVLGQHGSSDLKPPFIPQYLQVNPDFYRSESGISNASLRTLNYSSQGSLEEEGRDSQSVESVSNQFEKVTLSEGRPENVSGVANQFSEQPNYQAFPANFPKYDGNLNQSAQPPSEPGNDHLGSGSLQSESQAEEDQQGTALNDWEFIQPQSMHSSQHSSLDNSGVSFFIGGQENNEPGAGLQAYPQDGQVVVTRGKTDNAAAYEQAGVVSQPHHESMGSTPAPPPGGSHLGPPGPPSGGDSSTANPFRRASPRKLSRNTSNQSLPSLPSDKPVAASRPNPVIFNPASEIVDSSYQGGNSDLSIQSNSGSFGQPNDSRGVSSMPVAQDQQNASIGAGNASPFLPSVPKEEPQSDTSIGGQQTNAGLVDKPHSGVMPAVRNQRLLGADLPSGPGSSTNAQPPASGTSSVSDYFNQQQGGTGLASAKPSIAPGTKDSRANTMSPRRQHASAFHLVQSNRAKHNMSPAATLWENLDPPSTGIVLAPAAPLLATSATSAVTTTTTTSTSAVTSPVLPVIPMTQSLESKLKGSQAVTGAPKPLSSTPKEFKSDKKNSGQESAEKSTNEVVKDNLLKKEDDNRSINSLDEIDAKVDYRDDYRDGYYRDRHGYKDPRDYRHDGYYDRPSGRADSFREDYRHRDPYRGHYRDPYRDPYYDERYDRPRSRQEDDRPTSRSGRDGEQRPQSRSEYEREQYYRERDRYRNSTSSYDYDYYGRRPHYYDERDAQYYQYYHQRDARYARGYYEELGYYGQGYDNRYAQYTQYASSVTDDYDRYSQNSQSRGHTPALDELDQNQSVDYYRGHGSRSSSRQGVEESTGYPRKSYDYDNYAYDNYGYGYDYSYPQRFGYDYGDPYQQGEYQTGRMTPPKYSIPHMKACFGPNGQLIKVMPNRPADGQPATVEIHEIETMLSDITGAEELKSFPGPLTRAETHKNDVLQFCQLKARQCAEEINMIDRESAELIWKLLELLIKQNGSVVGTDIADLLLEGHEPSTQEYSMIGMKISQSMENLDTPDEDDQMSVTRVTSDRSLIVRGRSLDEVTDRFRNLVLYGRKKDALEWAMKNNLWGHALFLASKMDNRTHASVMTRFANSAMKMNDPLQTLYQLMSGRQPAAVTCVVDERWGDWRPHLAMILSNHTSKPELDRKSIAALGDTMATKGCLHASHFCYLMAQAGFGMFSKKISKLVLIGSSHNLPFEEFATSDAIQCTEIYEYAQSLCNPAFILPHFQVYKFLYATRLAEYGFPQEALHYCEVIANTVQQSPVWFQPAFVKVLYELSNRLKFHDLQRLQEGDDAEDSLWLQQLQRICQGYDDGSIQPVSGTATPACYGGTTASSESGEVANYSVSQDNSAAQYQYANSQDVSYHQNYAYQQTGQNQQQHHGGTGQQQIEGQNVQTTAQSGQTYDTQNHAYYQGQGQHQGYYGYQTTDQQGANQTVPTSQNTGYENYNTATTAQTGQQATFGTTQQDSFYQTQGYSRQQSQRGSIVSSHSIETEEDTVDESENQEMPALGSSAFDYFGAATTSQKIITKRSRYRTTSGSSSTGRRRTISESSTGSVKAAPSMTKSQTDSAASSKNKPERQADKGGGGGKGWFGGIFSKLSRRPKNEMILPDDKDPSIVWDPVKKKWTNTDGTEEEEIPAVPPPKDTELMGKPSGVANGAGPTGGPPAGNRFSRPKGRGDFGARNQYVDVLNPKTSSSPTVPSNLFNVMPSTNAPQQIFNPSSNVSADSSSQPAVPQGSKPAKIMQHLEPPQQPAGETTEQSAIQQPSEAPSAGPMMFNPAEFQSSQLYVQPSAGSGMKYGQRRKYPK